MTRLGLVPARPRHDAPEQPVLPALGCRSPGAPLLRCLGGHRHPSSLATMSGEDQAPLGDVARRADEDVALAPAQTRSVVQGITLVRTSSPSHALQRIGRTLISSRRQADCLCCMSKKWRREIFAASNGSPLLFYRYAKSSGPHFGKRRVNRRGRGQHRFATTARVSHRHFFGKLPA